jgi:hypothetical protein
MSAAEALPNLTSAPLIEVSPENVRQVSVVFGDKITVTPQNLVIPWGFNGTIIWTLDGVPGVSFADNGVHFREPAPFTVDPPAGQICQATVNNDKRSQTGVFAYDLIFSLKGVKRDFDPTVENDSPPPTEDAE